MTAKLPSFHSDDIQSQSKILRLLCSYLFFDGDDDERYFGFEHIAKHVITCSCKASRRRNEVGENGDKEDGTKAIAIPDVCCGASNVEMCEIAQAYANVLATIGFDLTQPAR